MGKKYGKYHKIDEKWEKDIKYTLPPKSWKWKIAHLETKHIFQIPFSTSMIMGERVTYKSYCLKIIFPPFYL